MKIEEMNIRLQIKRIKKKFCNFFKIDTYINGILELK